jgi:hypothetical protein
MSTYFCSGTSETKQQKNSGVLIDSQITYFLSNGNLSVLKIATTVGAATQWMVSYWLKGTRTKLKFGEAV